MTAFFIMRHPWRSSRELCSHHDSDVGAVYAGKQLAMQAKKDTNQHMAAPAQGNLSVKHLDAMAAARTNQQAAASSLRAEHIDGDTKALAGLSPPSTTPHAVATPFQSRSLAQRLFTATPGNADGVAQGAESGPPSSDNHQKRGVASPPEERAKQQKVATEQHNGADEGWHGRPDLQEVMLIAE